MRILICIALQLLVSITVSSQLNCNIYQGACKEACEQFMLEIKPLGTPESELPQGSKQSQMLFDKSIVKCPSIAYFHFEKSVPYLKRGLYREWKRLIDIAISYDVGYLLNRGANQIQYLRNYEEGLKDLNQLVEIRNSIHIGYSPSGEYHAQILRAICYQKLGNYPKALELIDQLLSSDNYFQDPYDFFHIGIINLEASNLEAAKEAFHKQNEYDEFAETYFYFAKVYDAEKNEAKQKEMLEKALSLYTRGKTMSNNYYHYIDKVFALDIQDSLDALK